MKGVVTVERFGFGLWLTITKRMIVTVLFVERKGFLHLIVPPERFTLLQGDDVLTTYKFNTGVAQHTFCRICGIHAFYRPRSHPNSIDVNVRCLDGDVLSHFEIVPFDGASWEENIHKLHQN